MIKYALNLDAMDDKDLLRVASWCIEEYNDRSWTNMATVVIR